MIALHVLPDKPDSLYVHNRLCCVSRKSDSYQALQESPPGPAMNLVLICDTFRRHWTSGRDKRGKLRSSVEVYCLRSEASFDISTPRSHRSAWADSPEVQNENRICRYGMIWICLEFDCFIIFWLTLNCYIVFTVEERRPDDAIVAENKSSAQRTGSLSWVHSRIFSLTHQDPLR